MNLRNPLPPKASAEIPSADSIPFGSFLTQDVVRLRDTGDLLACWRLDGISFETADLGYIADRKRALHNFWNAIGGGHCAVWSHKVRRAVHLALDGVHTNAFAREFSARYNAGLAGGTGKSSERRPQMVTELYLSLIYRPAPDRASRMIRKLSGHSLATLHARQTEAIGMLEELSDRLMSSLRPYGPERLGVFRRDDHSYSEQAAFLGFLINGVWEDVPYRDACLAEYLPVSRLHFGDKNGMLEIWHPTQNRFAGLLDFQDYPRISEPGMNNAILYSDYEYIETQSFSMLGKRDALDALERQRGHLYAADDPSNEEIEQMDAAMAEVNSGDIQMGEYHYSLAVFGEFPAQVAKHMAQARSALQDGPGFKMAVVDAIPECAWFAQLPGNWRMRPREASITSKNFTNLSPLHNFSQGKRYGNPWGEALAMMPTPSGQPFFFNHHVSPENQDSTDEKKPGNTIVIGQTGAGKTALVAGLMLFALKYSGMHGMFLDMNRGSEICIRRLGGRYCALKRGEPTGFNPSQLPPSEHNIAFCERWLRLLVGPAQAQDMAQEEQDISHAVRTVMSEAIPLELRRLATVWQNLKVRAGGNSLRDRLLKWTAPHRLGWLFDNPRHTHDLTDPAIRIHGYDYTEFIEDEEIRTPTVDLLLHLASGMIDGRPFIYWMEEFWKPLENDHFSDFALNKQKTIRKENGLGVFITQSPSDVLQHRISKTIVEHPSPRSSCRTLPPMTTTMSTASKSASRNSTSSATWARTAACCWSSKATSPPFCATT
jgi:type IV secretion system protein VirB4